METERLLIELAFILAGAKVGGEICERLLKQPAVLGELVVGVILGKSLLGVVNPADPFLNQLAQIGAVLLLFEVGLQTDLNDLTKVGFAAVWLACVGVALPFIFGYMAAKGMGAPTAHAVFIGAVLTATSVGITARVLSDLNALHMSESRIVLGAAVVDDVIGLIILAVMSALVIHPTGKGLTAATVLVPTGLAIAFLVGALALGFWLTPPLLGIARRMTVRAALPVAAVVFCLAISAAAQWVGLAAIVGAFSAGLILARAEHRVHFEPQVHALADIFVPVFFVMMGALVQLDALNPMTPGGQKTLLFGFILFVIAAVTKVIAGWTVPRKQINRMLTGFGMMPRGEVGLIFASIGLSSHIITNEVYAAILFVVAATTFITPPLLKLSLKPHGKHCATS